MARVGFVEYAAAQIKLPINYTETKGFTCNYAGTTYTHTDINALRAQVLAAIKDANQVSWTPVVLLSYSTASTRNTPYTYLSIERERIYIGNLPTAGYKYAHWSATEDKRLEVSRTLTHWEKGTLLTLPAQYASSFDGKTYLYLPYSEELWNALEEIQQYFQIATKQLTAHLQSPAGIALLLGRCRGLFDHAVTATGDEHEGGEAK